MYDRKLQFYALWITKAAVWCKFLNNLFSKSRRSYVVVVDMRYPTPNCPESLLIHDVRSFRTCPPASCATVVSSVDSDTCISIRQSLTFTSDTFFYVLRHKYYYWFIYLYIYVFVSNLFIVLWYLWLHFVLYLLLTTWLLSQDGNIKEIEL